MTVAAQEPSVQFKSQRLPWSGPGKQPPSREAPSPPPPPVGGAADGSHFRTPVRSSSTLERAVAQDLRAGSPFGYGHTNGLHGVEPPVHRQAPHEAVAPHAAFIPAQRDASPPATHRSAHSHAQASHRSAGSGMPLSHRSQQSAVLSHRSNSSTSPLPPALAAQPSALLGSGTATAALARQRSYGSYHMSHSGKLRKFAGSPTPFGLRPTPQPSTSPLPTGDIATRGVPVPLARHVLGSRSGSRAASRGGFRDGDRLGTPAGDARPADWHNQLEYGQEWYTPASKQALHSGMEGLADTPLTEQASYGGSGSPSRSSQAMRRAGSVTPLPLHTVDIGVEGAPVATARGLQHRAASPGSDGRSPSPPGLPGDLNSSLPRRQASPPQLSTSVSMAMWRSGSLNDSHIGSYLDGSAQAVDDLLRRSLRHDASLPRYGSPPGSPGRDGWRPGTGAGGQSPTPVFGHPPRAPGSRRGTPQPVTTVLALAASGKPLTPTGRGMSGTLLQGSALAQYAQPPAPGPSAFAAAAGGPSFGSPQAVTDEDYEVRSG